MWLHCPYSSIGYELKIRLTVDKNGDHDEKEN